MEQLYPLLCIGAVPSPFFGNAYGGRTEVVNLIDVDCFGTSVTAVSNLLDCNSDRSGDILQTIFSDMAAVRCDGELLIITPGGMKCGPRNNPTM